MDERPTLLCFDGSAGAAQAIATAGRLLGPRAAVVVTVWEPMPVWEPYDPGAVISAGAGSLGAKALGLEKIVEGMARTTVERGVEMARAAGFRAEPRTVCGKPWRAICDVAHEIEAVPIVLGARGLSRAERAILGSVSAAVVHHAARPVLVVPA